VLLTADAMARRDRDEDGALSDALEAVKLAPDLVPAAALAGQICRVAVTCGGPPGWSKRLEGSPHPELAETYLNLRLAIRPSIAWRAPRRWPASPPGIPSRAWRSPRAALEAREFARAARPCGRFSRTAQPSGPRS
jgi:HemY protein